MPKVIVVDGALACGKSSYIKKLQKDKNFSRYVVVSNDIQGTKAKCLKEFEKAIKNGHSVIVDNTNPTKEARDVFIRPDTGKSAAISPGIPTRIIFFDLPKDVVMHMNEYRSITTDKHVSSIAIHTYYKKLERPSEKDVTVVNKVEVTDPMLLMYLPE